MQAHKLAYRFVTMEKLSQRLKAARKKAGLTQRELAEVAGVSQPLISQIENEKNTSSADLSKLARACKVSTDWLAEGLGSMHTLDEVEAMLRQELSKPPSAKRLTATLGAAQMLGFGRFGSVVSPEVLARWESSGVSESEVDLYHEFEESLEGVFRDIEGDLSEYSHMANLELAGKAGFYRKYPVISSVEAGSWQETVDLYQPGHADDWEASSKDAGPNGFWLRVKGDSMT